MTPRRILLLLGGILLFCGVYAAYALALGWLDGLSQLPAWMLEPSDGKFQPPPRTSSPTVERLKDAFGQDCLERNDQTYPTKFEFRNGESSVVLAAGQPASQPDNPRRIVLSPFSFAVFGKPKPPNLRAPGEVTEITTFHSDKAVLEYDRPIRNPNDLNSATLVRVELLSEPESVTPDPRRGVVQITNNQKSADPNKSLLIRTPGPVFYRDPKGKMSKTDSGPDIVTDAAVEIIDRQNLPRAYGAPAPLTATTRGDELRDATAVAEILAGHRLPPPTVTAVGLRVYLEQDDKKSPPKKDKKDGVSVGGLRRLELQEKVLIHFWTDGRQSFVGGPAPKDDKPRPAAPKSANPLGTTEPPPATAGLIGGLLHGAETARGLEKALLQIETLGPFSYDAVTNVGRFDVVPQANPDLPNDVQVTRVAAQGGMHKLFSQVLELEFNGPPTGAKPDAPKGGDGPTFKRLHAWTYTPGRFLTVSSEGEQLEAYGQDLVHDQAASRTVLQGAPLYAVRERNVLTAGAAGRPAQLVLEPGPAPARANTATVRGPGRIELFDPASNGNTIVAVWATSLKHEKETVNGRELDRLTFTDAASFKDEKADYWLKGRELRLWIESAKRDPNKPLPKGQPAPQPLPHRLQAIGEVTSHSDGLDIEQAEYLNVMFRDTEPPPEPKAAAPSASPAPAAGPMPMRAVPPPKEEPKPKEQPKPPMKLKARTVDTWVVRYPTKTTKKPDPKAQGARANETAVKYELEKARCEGKVVVHQDPADPEKNRGVDILGNTLLLDQTRDGSVMTVTGTDDRPGEVHHEGTSIIGPTVVIDQLHNAVTVNGRGALQMPTGSDLSGTELAKAEVVTIHWRDKMEFHGATKYAEFFGKVNAKQGESWVVCHRMNVTFDRPIYFTQARKAADAPKKKDANGKDDPRIDRVFCYRAPDESAEDRGPVTFNQVERDAAGRTVKEQQLIAREMVMHAQAQDDNRGEKYQKVDAEGPGTLRTWQLGQKDIGGPAPAPGTPPKKDDSEMKLTVVTFGYRMNLKDKNKLYQEATFFNDVRVTSIPANRPDAKIERHNLPPGSVVLTCNDKLLVSQHKKGNGPPAQYMQADGNAFILSDEYEGWGERVTYDGKVMNLHGTGTTQARIRSRFGDDTQDGQTIVYDRQAGTYRVTDSSGGTIVSPQKKGPPPKKP